MSRRGWAAQRRGGGEARCRARAPNIPPLRSSGPRRRPSSAALPRRPGSLRSAVFKFEAKWVCAGGYTEYRTIEALLVTDLSGFIAQCRLTTWYNTKAWDYCTPASPSCCRNCPRSSCKRCPMCTQCSACTNCGG